MSSILNTKCSVCGGPLIFPAEADEVICEYCLRPNARPKSAPTETSLMKYANERRNIGEFDEAAIAYRKVLQANIEEHEARWGLLLCKYGVMYVEDAAGKERLITCRRAVNGSIQTEPDFRICCEQAGRKIRACYETDAAYIDEVQAEIRRIRQTDDPYDIFICYKETTPEGKRTRDSVFAQQIWGRMRQRGYRVFYAPESLKQKSGANYEAAIFAALTDAKVMVVVGTSREYFDSTWVRSEWKRYLDMIDAGEDKLLVPLYRDIDPSVDLPAEFRMRYLQGLNMADVGFLYDLEALMEKVIKKRDRHDQRQKVYDDAVGKLNRARTVEQCEEAKRLLMSISGFEGVDRQITACDVKIEQINQANYQTAERLQNAGSWNEAIRAFEKLGNYRDSRQRAQRCRQELENGEKAERRGRERERQEAERKPKAQSTKKRWAAFIAFVLLIAVGAAAYIRVIKPKMIGSSAIMEVGSTAVFGSYDQDGNTSNGAEAIEWIVLANDGDTATLISKYGLDAKPYNEASTSVTWETCTLREWLNGDFLNAAFTADELSRLETVTVTADANPSWSTDPGNDTRDKVYLLSIDEVKRYFASDADCVCMPTQTAAGNGAYTGNSGACWWWLRSPGSYTNFAARVNHDGSVSYDGYYVFYEDDVVRPVVALRLS